MSAGIVAGDVEITPEDGDFLMMFVGRKFKINGKRYICVGEREELNQNRKNRMNNSDHTYTLCEVLA